VADYTVVAHPSFNVLKDGRWVASFQNEADANAFVTGASQNSALVAELQDIITALEAEFGKVER